MIDLTIVIPTHNRHQYLARILDLYNPFIYKILIYDSTAFPFKINKFFKNKNIVYNHVPEMVNSKLLFALNEVKTTYVVFCADDDFIFPKALEESYNFLEKNKDYVCVQGHLIFYKYLFQEKNIEYNLYSHIKFSVEEGHNLSKDNSSVSLRVQKYSEPYRHFFYGLHRTDNAKSIFNFINKYELTQPYLFELCHTILTVITGKTKELDSLYHIREDLISSGAKQHMRIPQLVKEKHPELKTVKKLISNFLIINNMEKREATLLTNNIYNDFELFLDKNIKFRNMNTKYKKRILLGQEKEHIDLIELYKKESYLKTCEEIIFKHSINSGYDFSKNYKKLLQSSNISSFYNEIKKQFSLLKKEKKRIVIYGAGNLAIIIDALYHDQIKFFIDNNTNNNLKKINKNIVYSTDTLKNRINDYDVIIISVLGREKEITHFIKNVLHINKEIITI